MSNLIGGPRQSGNSTVAGLPIPAELANGLVRLKKLTQLQRFVAPSLVAVWLLSPELRNWREIES